MEVCLGLENTNVRKANVGDKLYSCFYDGGTETIGYEELEVVREVKDHLGVGSGVPTYEAKELNNGDNIITIELDRGVFFSKLEAIDAFRKTMKNVVKAADAAYKEEKEKA